MTPWAEISLLRKKKLYDALNYEDLYSSTKYYLETINEYLKKKNADCVLTYDEKVRCDKLINTKLFSAVKSMSKPPGHDGLPIEFI